MAKKNSFFLFLFLLFCTFYFHIYPFFTNQTFVATDDHVTVVDEPTSPLMTTSKVSYNSALIIVALGAYGCSGEGSRCDKVLGEDELKWCYIKHWFTRVSVVTWTSRTKKPPRERERKDDGNDICLLFHVWSFTSFYISWNWNLTESVIVQARATSRIFYAF